MKKIWIGIVLMIFGFGAGAQQLGQFSQFFMNDYVINPAVGGTKPYFDVRSSYRYQWVGVSDAPRTFLLSMNGPVNKKGNMGIGGYVYADVTGPTRRTGFKISYAYNFKVTSDIKLSFGLSGGLMQFSVDGTEIELADQNDVALGNSLTTAYTPDAAFGAYLYHDDFYVSLSIPQLIGTEMKFVDNHRNSMNKLNNHYYFNAGYRFHVGDDWMIEPMLQVKYIPPINPQLDLGARVHYKEMVWLGAAWRSEDAATVFAGMNIAENFTLGIPTTSLPPTSTM
ncbi:type IX secretion system membrane protein PorP/SprF [bacterium SCSIO 12741]|nr:type IX secretion system membrane protein PorP/SprF [bacterium SCSIO 12741]